MSNVPYKLGDWVRFYQNGKLVIGVVQYVRYDSLTFHWDVMTDVGSTWSTHILEARLQ